MSVSIEEYQLKKAESDKLRSQQFQLNEKIVKLEGELKILSVKSSAFEQQLGKMVVQNKNLIALLQKEQQEKLVLLAKDRESSNNQNRGQVEARRNQAILKNLSLQVQNYRSQIAKTASQKIQLAKEKQELTNKLLIAEQKLKANKNLDQVIVLLKNSLSDVSNQNDKLKLEVSELKKRVNSGAPIEKTIIKNNSEMIDELIKDFQEKLNGKQRSMAEQREKYQNRISQLNLKIAQLEAKNSTYL